MAVSSTVLDDTAINTSDGRVITRIDELQSKGMPNPWLYFFKV